jgi:hypothetical protein
MTKTLTTISLLLTFFVSFGQTTYEPQILILSPNDIKHDKAFDKEITDYNILLNKNIKFDEQQKGLKSEEFSTQPANIKRMMQSEVAYSKNLDFFKQTSYICEQFLTYKFFEKFPNLLIELKDIKSKGSIEDLKRISGQAKLQYVLNFPSILFYKENDISYAKLAVQLYDYSTNSLLIDTSYIGNWNNPGFEFACSDGSLSCTINNSLSQALDNVVYNIATNSSTLKKERALSKERLETIRNNYYKKPFSKSFISNIIPLKDSNINLNNLYQTLINEDSTKFVGFFLDKVAKQNFKQLNENKNDNNVNIINDKSIKDTGYLDNIPQTYAYIVKAVKYKGKWYYEKSNVTYFEPQDNEEGRLQFLNNLQTWNFFKEALTTFNPDFWETNLFNKVKDLRKDPEWNKYGTTIWKTEEEENRNYIGLYEIVADQLKNKKAYQIKQINVN